MTFKLAAAALLAAGLMGGPATAKTAPHDPDQGVVSTDFSAKKKVKKKAARKHHHSMRHHRNSYGWDRHDPYPRQGYYRGVTPQPGYGPDPGDRAWPPFHFKPYY